MTRLLCTLLLLTASKLSFGLEAITLNQGFEELRIGEYVEYYASSDNSSGYPEISASPFVLSEDKRHNAGLFDGTLWGRFKVYNPQSEKAEFMFVSRSSMFRFAKLYSIGEDGVNEYLHGFIDGERVDEGKSSRPFFILALEPGETRTFYVQVGSFFPYRIDPLISSDDSYRDNLRRSRWREGVFVGVIFSLIFLNLAQFIALPAPYLLALSGAFLFGHILTFGRAVGGLGEALFINWEWFHVFLPIYSKMLFGVFMIWFYQSWFEIDMKSKPGLLFRSLLAINLLCMIAFTISPSAKVNMFHNLVGMIFSLVTMLVYSFSYIKKDRFKAYYYIASWAPFLLSILFIGSAGVLKMSLVDDSTTLELLIYIPVQIQALILTLGSSFRIQRFRKEESLKNERYAAEVKQLNDKLMEKTTDLEFALKDRELQLDEATKNLMESSRRAGMSSVAANVIHSIGNLINSVNVSLEQLKENTDKNKALQKVVANLEHREPEELKELDFEKFTVYLRESLKSLEAQAKLDSEEVDLIKSKIKAIQVQIDKQKHLTQHGGVFADESCNEFFSKLVVDCQRRFPEIRIIQEKLDTDIKLHIDSFVVKQVFNELILNASQAMSNEENKEIQIALTYDEAYVEVFVSDKGVGIDPGIRERVFRLGAETHSESDGYGLHNCANDLHQMGGQIKILDPRFGYATTVLLRLPVSKPSLKVHSNA